MRRRRADFGGVEGSGTVRNCTVVVRGAAEPLLGARRTVPLSVHSRVWSVCGRRCEQGPERA